MSSTALLLAGVGRLPGRRARSSGDRALPCGGRGRTFESCRAHGSTKPFSKARNAEKCTIRTSYSASATSGEANEPCPEGARSGGLLGLAYARTRGLGAPQDGVLQDRTALLRRASGARPR